LTCLRPALAGWTFAISRGAEGDKFKLDEALDAEALLLGRVTYEGFAAAWPSMEGEFADKFNSMPKYVVSSTLQEPAWKDSAAVALGRKGGLKGGRARPAKMTPEERSEQAKHAARARWAARRS